MRTHPLWRPYDVVDLEEAARLRVGRPRHRPITVVPYDDAWPAAFAEVERTVRAALGERVLALSHVGSTSVPGLAAKPVIDVDLTVADSADEPAYLPPLEAAGFSLRVREPDWEEHRLFTDEGLDTHLHVFSPGSPELARHLLFRDWLREHREDRAVYGAFKQELAQRGFTDGMDYNNHKSALVYDIYERVLAADPAHPHDPHPRG